MLSTLPSWTRAVERGTSALGPARSSFTAAWHIIRGVSDEAVRDAPFKYDVALSFAGEDRAFVEVTAAKLRQLGVRVFYDDYERVELWGKDLYEHLDYVYQRAARFCVIFVSEHYARKVWTNHERKSAQARAITEAGEYVLPFRFDETELPGLRRTVGYLDSSKVNAATLAELINTKLGPRVRKQYFPPEPDALFEALDVTTDEEKEAIRGVASGFMLSLARMTEEERWLLGTIFAVGCPSEMPQNMHVELDIIRRDLAMPIAEIQTKLRGMSALGVEMEIRESGDEGASHEDATIAVSWSDHTIHPEHSLAQEFAFERSTEIAAAMLEVGMDHYCLECARDRIVAMDFSCLARDD